jgi:hypothetical protein
MIFYSGSTYYVPFSVFFRPSRGTLGTPKFLNFEVKKKDKLLGKVLAE